jgi:hypothetical protein
MRRHAQDTYQYTKFVDNLYQHIYVKYVKAFFIGKEYFLQPDLYFWILYLFLHHITQPHIYILSPGMRRHAQDAHQDTN